MRSSPPQTAAICLWIRSNLFEDVVIMDIPSDTIIDLFRRVKHTPESLRAAGERMADRFARTWFPKILGGVQVWRNMLTGEIRREPPEGIKGIMIPADVRIKIGELS